MIPWPVSQHALHNCRLRLLDRVIDGASGARFLQTFKAMIENPLELVL